MTAPSEIDLVSIIIPVFNGAEYLAEAIDSALAQTWPHTEVIVVDDGSDDDGRTRAIAESYGERIRLVTKPNGGVATALNAGIAAMRGRWFSWLSHDDLYVPHKVETQLRALCAMGGDAIAFSDFELMDAAGVPIAVKTVTDGFNPDQPLWAVFEGRLNGCAMMIPRRMLEASGGFDPGRPTTQDYAMWFQLLRRHRALPVPGVLVRQRIHVAQGSRHDGHLVEAGLLWAEMATTVTAEEMQRHAPNEIAFLRRIAVGAAASAYPGAAEAIRACMTERLRLVRIGLVWVSDGVSHEGPHRALAAITTAGMASAGAVVVDASRGAGDSLEFRAMVGHALPILRVWPDVSPAALLEAAAMLDAAIVVFASEAVPVAPATLQHAAAIILSGEADGVTTGAGLQGAILSMDAVRVASARRARSTDVDAGAALAETARLVALSDDRREEGRAHVTAPPAVATRDLSRLAAWTLCLAERLHERWPVARDRIGPAIARAFMRPGSFDRAAYLEAYTDVRDAGADPHLHYLLHGQWEGRSARPFGVTEPQRPSVVASHDGLCRLLILHGLGGGTRRYVDMRATELRRQGILPILVWGTQDCALTFEGLPGVDGLRSVPLTDGPGEAIGLLRGLTIDRIEVLHTIGMDAAIMPLLAALGRPYDVTLLDYHLVATHPHLLDGAGNTAAVGDEEDAVRALLRPAPHPILTDAATIQACSRDLAERVRRFVPGLSVTVAPPPERPVPERFHVRQPKPPGPDEALRVLFLGDLALHKGSETLLGAAAEAARRGLPIEFHQLGRLHAFVPFERQSPATLRLHGGFDQDQLPALVATINPHLAWFPAMAPETYGFALSEAMLLGLPILARGLGAYPERLAGRAYSWVVPATSDNSPVAWVERLMTLLARGLADDSSIHHSSLW